MRSPARVALALALVSASLLAARLYAAARVGFGDSEALYACYAMHPQPAHLDHPDLIGVFARAIGHGGAPTPYAAHVVTALLATALPWFFALVARAAGASWRGALVCALAIAAVPEIAIGLFAMTPDLLLCFAWLAALGMASYGLRAIPGSARATAMLVGAGLAAGVASTAKISGLALFAVLAATYATPRARAHAKTLWPWAGLVAGAIVLAPVVLFEAHAGWPLLRHRLIDTQQASGISLRNLGALVLGQLGYLSPLLAVAAVLAARSLWRSRHQDSRSPVPPGAGQHEDDRDAVTMLLFYAFVIPFAVLLPLCLWSRVAEPHWVAPALLALPIHAARASKPVLVRWLTIAAISTSLALVAGVYAWVLVPDLLQLAPKSYDARFDIANELYGWPQATRLVQQTILEETQPGAGDPGGFAWAPGVNDFVVVGPHWTVCAQLHAALGKDIPVGCATEIPDDFDEWLPRAAWRRSDTILFVSDSRFDEVDLHARFPDHVWVRDAKVTVFRGGRVARVFTVRVLQRRAAA